MKAIREYDEIIHGFEVEGKKFSHSDADNFDLFNAYYKSVHLNGNNIIDFNDIIWEERIPELFDAMLAHGISDFTVSSRQSGIQDIITEFMDCGDGMELSGMTLVKDGFTEWRKVNDEYIEVPRYIKAFHLHIIDISQYHE